MPLAAIKGKKNAAVKAVKKGLKGKGGKKY